MFAPPAESARSAAAASPGQGFRALTERWTRDRVERVVALLHAGDRAGLEAYLAREVPRVVHPTDPPGSLDLKGISFASLGYRVDLGRVRFEGLNLWSSRFVDTNLKGASFERCALGQCVFESAYLRGAHFRDCDLHAAAFSRSNLGGARFERTALRFSTWTATDVSPQAFAGGLHEENDGRYALAAGVYHALRLNLSAAGDESGASWAAYRQCVMRRRDLRARRRYRRWLASYALDLLWGYGERPWRLMACALAFCALCAACYFFTGIRLGDRCVAGGDALPAAEHAFECLYFSVVTFTTVGYGDVTPCGAASRALAALEAFAGVFAMGLFVTANVRKLDGR
jgi:ion channel/pentapeptide repeat protein